MAELSVTRIGDRRPCGNLFAQVFKVTLSNSSAGSDWFPTDFENIVAVRSCIGTGSTGRFVANIIKNARGTDVAEGTNPGDLGIEILVGVDAPSYITVLGV